MSEWKGAEAEARTTLETLYREAGSEHLHRRTLEGFARRAMAHGVRVSASARSSRNASASGLMGMADAIESGEMEL